MPEAHYADHRRLQRPCRQPYERFSVRTHLAMCINCRRFIRQLRLTQRVVQQLPEAEISDLDALAERLSRSAEKPE